MIFKIIYAYQDILFTQKLFTSCKLNLFTIQFTVMSLKLLIVNLSQPNSDECWSQEEPKPPNSGHNDTLSLYLNPSLKVTIFYLHYYLVIYLDFKMVHLLLGFPIWSFQLLLVFTLAYICKLTYLGSLQDLHSQLKELIPEQQVCLICLNGVPFVLKGQLQMQLLFQPVLLKIYNHFLSMPLH